MSTRRPGSQLIPLSGGLLAVAGPAALTAVLLHVGTGQPREYVFLYLALVAALGVLWGLVPSLICAAASFLLVDYYFVPPVHALSIADATDLVNLLVFFGAAGTVGGLGSYRRRSGVRAETLTQELRAANAELVRLNRDQAEASQLALRLARTEQQVRALEESDRIRREFLANVSHELRTPISTILTTSTGALDSPQLADSARTSLSSIADEARRLAALVSDLLDMSRIEGDSLELRLEPIELAEAIGDAVDRLKLISPHREVEWNPETSAITVQADWSRLAQILDNLLVNADRYAPPGTPIEVDVAPRGREMVAIRVRDHGPGIPAELGDRIFDRFVRGGDGHARGSGLGLGLAIVRGLVEAHAGTVTAETVAPGDGASFVFTLPRMDR